MASLTHPIRVEILGELEKSPLSPSEFTRRHPAYSLPFVRGHFRSLESLGYIEKYDGGIGGGVRYRPAERALFFDVERLQELGSTSSHYTSSICITYAERIAEALQAGTFSSRASGRFMWTVVYLDESKWRVAVKVTNALFWYSLHLHEQAMARLKAAAGPGIPATTGFSCIASPMNSGAVPIIPPMTYTTPEDHSRTGSLRIRTNVARALAHPVRVRILGELKKRPMGPAEISAVCDGPALETIVKHCVRLEEFDLVRRLRRDRRHVYRLEPTSLFEPKTYTSLPAPLRGDVDIVSASTYVSRIADSIFAGTIEDRLDSHLTWTGLTYDAQAMDDLARALDAVFLFVLHLQRHSDTDPSDSIPVTLGYGCFESPPTSRMASPERLRNLYFDESPEIRRRELSWIEQIIAKVVP